MFIPQLMLRSRTGQSVPARPVCFPGRIGISNFVGNKLITTHHITTVLRQFNVFICTFLTVLTSFGSETVTLASFLHYCNLKTTYNVIALNDNRAALFAVFIIGVSDRK